MTAGRWSAPPRGGLPWLALMAMAVPVAAQDAPLPTRLTVRTAIDLALDRNPALNQAVGRAEALDGRWWAGFGLSAPEVIYLQEGVPDGAAPGIPDFTERRWGIVQSVESPLQSLYRLRRIDAERDAARLDVAARRVTVRSGVKQAYVELVYAQAILDLRRREVALARDLDDAVRTRVEVGESAEIDILKADLQTAEAESDLAEAEREMELARYALFQVVGLDPEAQRYEVTFPDSMPYVEVEIAQDEILAGLDGLPSLRAADALAEAGSLGVREAAWSAFPKLEVQLYTQDLGTGFDFHGVQVGFSMPVWFLLDGRGRTIQAGAEARVLVSRRQETFLAVKRDAEQAWHSYDTSLDVVRRYGEGVNARADELLDLTQEGYRLGELELLELLDTQRTVLASRKRYWDALRAYYASLIELERFAGRELVFTES